MRRIRTEVVDGDDLPELDLAAADEWRFLVMHGSVPRSFVAIASPGEAGPATLELALRRPAERAREEELLRRQLREQLGGPPAPVPPLRISVVVPTRRRPEVLVGLLSSITDLDPAPDEVIVVDNDPGDEDSRPLVDAVGFRYVREDRRGLNVARRTGLLAATGDVVVFTDDDCIVSPGWLAALPELFADPLVGIAAGPGYAHKLDTGAQLRREEEAGFVKGLASRRFDWRRVSPPRAGAVGSGNSMAMRRAAALALEVFPPELDAGTRAPAAGDLFAIFRFLAAGFDAVYEPRMLFWHRHAASGLARTIRNYGHGAGAFYTKVLVEEREWGVIPVWYWFVRRWIEAILDAQSGLADRGRVRVRWSYLKASLFGPVAWRRALSELDPEGRRVLAASRAAALAPPPVDVPDVAGGGEGPRPSVSVIVADSGEGAAGLVEQLDLGPEDEVIVRGGEDRAAAWRVGAGAATRDILLFLDSRARPSPGLVGAHGRIHADRRDVVVAGRTVLAPVDRRLATLAAWRDSALRRPVLLATSNLSVPRALFEGGASGAALVHEAAAVAVEPVSVTTAEYVGRSGAVAVALEVLERLRFRRAWASLAQAARAEPPTATLDDLVDAERRRTNRADWRARAHAAAGRPGRETPVRDATTAIILGPAHGERERAAARSPSLVEARGTSDRLGHWRAIAAAVAACDADVIGLPLRGTCVRAPWLAEMVAALEGSRVACVVGAGLAPEDPPATLGLSARATVRARYSGAGCPPQFIALRRDLYEAVGGLDPEAARLGRQAPLLDYVERALDAGLVVARLDAHGVAPHGCHRPARSAGEWHRNWARGALHARQARELGGIRGVHSFVFQGFLPMVHFRRPDRTGRKSARHALGTVLAFLLGAAAARPQPRSRGLV